MSEIEKNNMSVINQRLSVARTVDTTLTPEEEELFNQASKNSKATSKSNKTKAIIFTAIMIFLTGLLIYLLTFVVKF